MDYYKEINFELIKKLCGQEMSFRLQAALRNHNDNVVKIVNTGMVSSGKSSLYNLLTDNAMEERFPTGAARTTTNADVYQYKNMEYIDTPGIDVRDNDDEIAYKTVIESDIVLMIHNIKTGPLTRSESDWLSRIAQGMNGAEMCRRRIVFICTWKDTRENDEGYNEIIDNVKNMVFEAVGAEIQFFDVSVKKYLDGIRKNKEVLCQRSGIIDLKDFIENFARQYAQIKSESSFQVLEQIAAEVCGKLKTARIEDQKLIDKKASNVNQKFNSLRNSWGDVFNYFKNRRDALAALKQELKNI